MKSSISDNKDTENKRDIEKNFRFASSLIKIITILIAVLVLVVSKYAFIFFSTAMLPTIFSIFLDKNLHKCASATICSFNLMGIFPYLCRLWDSSSVNNMAKNIIADLDTWMVIYGTAFIGQLVYMFMPLIVVKFYIAKNQIHITNLQKKQNELAKEWSITIDKKES